MFFWKRAARLVLGFLALLVCAGCGGASDFGVQEPSNTSPSAIKVACLGDSITSGYGLASASQTYPAQLGALLGSGYAVGGFGVSGTTALNGGSDYYGDTDAWKDAQTFDPQLLIVFLGSNDVGNTFDAATSARFVHDYEALVAPFKAQNPGAKVFVCLPILERPYTCHNDAVLQNQIFPLLKQIATDEGAGVIDLHGALSDTEDDYTDTEHPNAHGAALIAQAIDAALTSGTASASLKR